MGVGRGYNIRMSRTGRTARGSRSQGIVQRLETMLRGWPGLMALGGLLLAAAAVVLAVTGPLFGDDDESPRPSTTVASSSSGYWSSNGATPKRSQTCDGLLGACLDQPLESFTADLPAESRRERVEGSADTTREWNIDGATWIIARVNEVGAIVTLSLTTSAEIGSPAEDVGDTRVSLNHGLVFGTATISKVIEVMGDPWTVTTYDDEAQGIWITACYQVGGEAVNSQRYSTYVSSSDPGLATLPSLDDAVALLRAVGNYPVLRFSVANGGIDQRAERAPAGESTDD